MDILNEIISNQARAEIFRLLFSRSLNQMYLREMKKHSPLALSAFQKELSHLKKLNLITDWKDGNRIIFKANKDHPLFSIISELVEKTSGVTQTLKNILLKIPEIEIAFIFGSYAKGTEKAESDIDLVVIGDASLRSLTPQLKKITEISGREVNPHVYSMKTWKEKLKKSDHFLKSILQTELIFLIGDKNGLS